MLVIAASLIALGASQSQECVYRVGYSPLELNLESLRGQRYTLNTPDGTEWMYSPCQNAYPCSHAGVTTQAMVDHSPYGIQECFTWAQFDTTIQPFYNFNVASWIFNYSNGEPCPTTNQVNRTATIIWTCEPDHATPRFVDSYEYDECNVMLELKWAGACAPPPPPNEFCEFKSGIFGGPTLNLSSIRGSIFSLTQQDRNGNPYTYEFSPCANSITCYSSTSGYSKQVMADIRDSGKQCAKYLAVWSGDAQPFYDRTIFGQDYWDFFWMDGEECSTGGPLEVLNVRYYCNPSIATLNITKAYENGPCQFRIEIDTNLACRNASDS
eukprot:539240_1